MFLLSQDFAGFLSHVGRFFVCFLRSYSSAIAGLKLLGLVGAMAMLTINGMVPAKDAAQNATGHVVFMLLFVALACIFIYWYRLAARLLSTPFESDIRIAAEMVATFEKNTKSTAGSIRDATRTAVADAENRGCSGPDQGGN